MSSTLSSLTSHDLAGAIWRYRIMAWVVGTMLLFLCAVALPLQYIGNKPELATVGFTFHGIFYIVYLVTVAMLGRRAKFRLSQLIGLVCAGFVPGLAFYVEHRTMVRLHSLGLFGGEDAEAGAPGQVEGASRSAR